MFVVYVCIYYFFKIYFIFLVARGIKPTSTCPVFRSHQAPRPRVGLVMGVQCACWQKAR